MSAALPSAATRRPSRNAKSFSKEVPHSPLRPSHRPPSASFERSPFVPLELCDDAFNPTADGKPYLVVGNAGDHAAIHQFLMAVFQGPPADVFLATLDDPFYEPCDRILVKRGEQILAHAHLTRRAIYLGEQRVPVSGLWSLGTLPEHRGRGYARSLLRVADALMREDDAALGLLRTRIPHFFRREGWAVCGRRCHSQANTRDLLAQLAVGAERGPAPRLTIRPWRQVELPALMRLYRQRVAQSHGAFERTENYWRWLISRKGFDQIYVAIEGEDRFELDPACSPIVGYAVTSESRIWELMTAPGQDEVAEQLLRRACSEAIERDHHTVAFHGPPNEPLHRLFAASGGAQHCRETHGGEVLMVKVLDPLAFLRSLCPELHRRADEARLTRPCELGLEVDGQRYRLIVSRRSVKVASGRLNRSYLKCNAAEFTRLVLGHDDLDDAIGQGRLVASTRVARQIGRVLFPQCPLWRPAFDDLRL